MRCICIENDKNNKPRDFNDIINKINHLKFMDIEKPIINSNQILIEVHATSITADELIWPETWDSEKKIIIPCHDVSGVVIEVGSEIKKFNVGDEIFGLINFHKNGALSEYAIVVENEISKKPKKLNHVFSSSVPLVCLTAWESLIDIGKLKKDETILIHGSSGGVGSYSIQIAKWIGANVIASGSTKNKAFIYSLGADKFIDYTKEDFENITKDVDLVLDTVGIEVFEKSINVLKNGGRLISLASNSYNEKEKHILKIKSKNINVEWFIVSPNEKNLEKISYLIDQEIIKVYIDKIINFEEKDIKQAFNIVQERHTKGKIVINIK